MSAALNERASAIRHYLNNRGFGPANAVFAYSLLAASFEQLTLKQGDGLTTPGEDDTLRETTHKLQVLTKKLFDREDVTYKREDVTYKTGFLPTDPQRIFSDSWVDCARVWFK